MQQRTMSVATPPGIREHRRPLVSAFFLLMQ
jgi:hypothetical protein